tara:strand:+ start:283 stop:513 length:231 start_codon:yes stop_codon:yes gene_type:complete
MKNKNTFTLLAIFGGVLGLHRFYVGQVFKGLLCIPLGLVFAPFTGVYWLLSSTEAFDNRYNKQRMQREILETLKNK